MKKEPKRSGTSVGQVVFILPILKVGWSMKTMEEKGGRDPKDDDSQKGLLIFYYDHSLIRTSKGIVVYAEETGSTLTFRRNTHISASPTSFH